MMTYRFVKTALLLLLATRSPLVEGRNGDGRRRVVQFSTDLFVENKVDAYNAKGSMTNDSEELFYYVGKMTNFYAGKMTITRAPSTSSPTTTAASSSSNGSKSGKMSIGGKMSLTGAPSISSSPTTTSIPTKSKSKGSSSSTSTKGKGSTIDDWSPTISPHPTSTKGSSSSSKGKGLSHGLEYPTISPQPSKGSGKGSSKSGGKHSSSKRGGKGSKGSQNDGPYLSPSDVPSISTFPSLRPTPQQTENIVIRTTAVPTESLMPTGRPTNSQKPSTFPTTSTAPSADPTTSISPSVRPSVSNTPTFSPSVSALPSALPTVSLSPTGLPTLSVQPSEEPTLSKFPSMLPSLSPVPSELPTISMSPSEFPTLSVQPSEEPTISAFPTNSPSTSLVPSVFPTASMSPSSLPTLSLQPSEGPTLSVFPTNSPSTSVAPSEFPTVSMFPSDSPSISLAPSESPTLSVSPTQSPTVSMEPSAQPTLSVFPSVSPTDPPEEIANADGFDCEPDGGIGFALNKNPSSYPFPSFVATNASDPNTKCFLRMTRDNAQAVATSAFLPFNFAPNNAKLRFRMSIGYRIYGGNDGSADGMVFVMHQDPRGLSALGGNGGDLGIYGPNRLWNSLAIEWDTHENRGFQFDNGENNIHIMTINRQGRLNELAETRGIPIHTPGTQSGRMWVDYCQNDRLEVYINNTGHEKPLSPQAAASINLSSFFVGKNVVLGYTAATWDEADYQDITSWSFVQFCDEDSNSARQEPVQSYVDLATQSPSSKPSEQPTNAPSTSQTNITERGLALDLTSGVVLAGTRIGLLPTRRTDNGDDTGSMRNITYEISSSQNDSSGTMPIVQDGDVLTFADTRGVYTIAGSVDGTTFRVSRNFLVLHNSDQAHLYSTLSTAVSGVLHHLEDLDLALVKNDVATIQEATKSLRELRNSIDVDTLRRSTFFAPEKGFLPSPDHLIQVGILATVDDEALQSLVESITKNLITFSDILSSSQDWSILKSLDREFEQLTATFVSLNPSSHGWVLSIETVNYLLAVVVPNFLHILVSEIESSLPSEYFGIRQRRASLWNGNLAEIAAQLTLRMRTLQSVYYDVLLDLARSVAALATSDLLRSYVNVVDIKDIVTSGGLSEHIFGDPGSVIEATGVNSKYPERSDVLLVNEHAIPSVKEVITLFNPNEMGNLWDVYEYFNRVIKAAESGSTEEMTQIADSVNTECSISNATGCISLVYDAGFADVNVECASCVGRSVLVVVMNLDSGGWSYGEYIFE